jgi:hypothetical protein
MFGKSLLVRDPDRGERQAKIPAFSGRPELVASL